jgi:integrase
MWSKARVAHLRTFFADARAADITTLTMRDYAKRRLAGGATPGTVNRDFFTLAIQAGRMSRRPYIPRLPEGSPRQGFMEHADYLAIRQHLCPAFQDVLDFGYLTGWRRGEVFTLEWRDLDRNAGVIRLRPEMCKTREGLATGRAVMITKIDALAPRCYWVSRLRTASRLAPRLREFGWRTAPN